jgi:transcription antitermination factor NusG
VDCREGNPFRMSGLSNQPQRADSPPVPDTGHQSRFAVGQQVRVTAGVFSGLVGTVQLENSERIVVSVCQVPHPLRVEIDRRFVVPLEPQ